MSSPEQQVLATCADVAIRSVERSIHRALQGDERKAFRRALGKAVRDATDKLERTEVRSGFLSTLRGRVQHRRLWRRRCADIKRNVSVVSLMALAPSDESSHTETNLQTALRGPMTEDGAARPARKAT
jgi:hypothetical protein